MVLVSVAEIAFIYINFNLPHVVLTPGIALKFLTPGVSQIIFPVRRCTTWRIFEKIFWTCCSCIWFLDCLQIDDSLCGYTMSESTYRSGLLLKWTFLNFNLDNKTLLISYLCYRRPSNLGFFVNFNFRRLYNFVTYY